MKATILTAIFLACTQIQAMHVVTSTPDLAWLARELLSEDAHVESLTQGDEDLHRVEAVPSFILATRKADVLCFIGKSLELAWIPKLIEASANQKFNQQQLATVI